MKKILLLVIFLLLFIQIVSAQLAIESASVCPAIQSITDKSGTTCLSIILWWALIALIFSELTKLVFHHNKSVAGILAIIISLIAVRFVPADLLFLSESFLFVVLLIAGPPLLARFFTEPGGLRTLLTIVFYGAVAYFWLGDENLRYLPEELLSTYIYLWQTRPIEMGIGHLIGAFLFWEFVIRRLKWFRRSAAEVERDWRKQAEEFAKGERTLTERLKYKYGRKQRRYDRRVDRVRWGRERASVFGSGLLRSWRRRGRK